MSGSINKKNKEAIALLPLIENLRESLDRFQRTYKKGGIGDVESALLDLKANFEDLEDAVDKNSEAA